MNRGGVGFWMQRAPAEIEERDIDIRAFVITAGGSLAA
jgi:hypothetical protein